MTPLDSPSLSLQGNNDEEAIPVGTATAAGGGQQRKQPMVELIESNTKLNQDLDQVRKEYKQCLEDMETTKENTEQLMNEERQSMEEQTQAAIEEEKDLIKELVAIQTTDLVQAYWEEERAKLARDQAQDRLRVAQEMADAQHQKFMEDCRMYRINIQRLSCQGECLGVDQHLAPLLACAVLQGPSLQLQQNTTDEEGSTESTGIAVDGNQGSEQFDSILASMWEAAGLAATNDDDTEGDEELEEALRALEEQKASSKLAEVALEEELKKKDTLIEDQEKRDLHKESLKAQFQRLTDDVDKLRSQITSFQRQSKEATDIASTYQRSKCYDQMLSRSLNILCHLILCDCITAEFPQASKLRSRSGKQPLQRPKRCKIPMRRDLLRLLRREERMGLYRILWMVAPLHHNRMVVVAVRRPRALGVPVAPAVSTTEDPIALQPLLVNITRQ